MRKKITSVCNNILRCLYLVLDFLFFFLMDGSTSCIVALKNFSPASSFAIDFLLKHPVSSLFHVCYQLAFLSYTFLPLLHFVSFKQRQVCTPHENDSKSLNLCPHVIIFIKLSILCNFFSYWFLHRIWLPWSVPWRTSRIHSSATLNVKWVPVINSCYFGSIRALFFIEC